MIRRDYDSYEIYQGSDLGACYEKDQTKFRLWAPSADNVTIAFYREGNGDCRIKTCPMKKAEGGTWTHCEIGDMNSIYYTYLVDHDGRVVESGDPYGKACGVNGVRSMVCDLKATDPEGFASEKRPMVDSPVDAVVCEISVADMTGSTDSGVIHKGKYLGLTEHGTKTANGFSTGLDYLKELGITHVQLMPAYDFGSIDESRLDIPQYNWGYDPINYNIPEGSYATDPFHGEVRIKEMKEMIHALHESGIGVIMDVVYNHTFDIDNNVFQKTEPDYYYRTTENGYSDASACGNEVASERAMVRKFIVDSVVYWAKEYHIDGFRFDLMAVLDLETMKAVRKALDEINPKILIYGEGWAGGPSVYPEEKRAFKTAISKIDGVAAFSDDIRDGIRGHVFYSEETGFINGKENMENDIRFSVVGAVMHPQVDYQKYTYTKTGPWAKNPLDTVNYISCHDNLTLWDKLTVSCKEATYQDKLAMNRLGAAIVMSSQGMPFFLSGEEIGRTKPIEGSDQPCENSYNMPAYTNMIRYCRREEMDELCSYYKGLIAFRKSHEGFRLRSAEEVHKSIQFLPVEEKGVVAFLIVTEKERIFVAYNASREPVLIQLPDYGEFQMYVEGKKAGCELLGCIAGQALIQPVSATMAVSLNE